MANHTSAIMLALGLALTVLILLRRSYRYFGRKSSRSSPPIEKVPRPTESLDLGLKDAPPQLLRWQVDMHETARDLKAQLDSKVSVLRQLLLMAEQEREKLERSIARAEQLGLSGCHDVLSEIRRVTAQPPNAANHDPSRVSLGHLPPTSAAARGQLAVSKDQQRAVYRLADLGHTPPAIADQVGLTVGDVEMMLSLRSKGE